MRQDFNWSQLDRVSLYKMLYTAGADIVGKKMPVKILHKRLSAHIKSCLPVSVKKWQYDAKQDRGFPYMGGAYDSVADKKGKKKFIEIVLSYNPLDSEVFITKYRWTRICSLFADTVLHEIIHMLGFTSYCNADGSSQASANVYTSFDEFLLDPSNNPLLVTSGSGSGMTVSVPQVSYLTSNNLSFENMKQKFLVISGFST